MMDELIFKHLKAIGDIKLEISNAGTMDVALEKCLKIVAAVCRTDTAVLWYYDSTGDHKLHPQYWMGSENVMKITYEPGEGIVGQVFKTGKSVNIFDYKSHADIKDKAFSDMQIKSMICVPLENQYETLGCLQFIKKECEDKPFDEEDASVCEILSMLAATAIDDNNLLFDKWSERKAIVTLNNVTKEFRNGDIITKVLKGLNLEVYEGEMLVILGESGCGKSTALNIIGGMDRMTSGTFTFMGKDYSNADEKVLTEYRRSSLGFVFQSYNLMPNLTARQNIKFIAELSKNSHDPDKVLDMVGLTSRKNNYPSQMSGGQQQRVSIARAIVKNPKIILADEPTAALDYATSIEVLTVMENIISTGTTIVMVTHNEEITRMANRVIRMRNGVAAEIIMNRHPVKASELVW